MRAARSCTYVNTDEWFTRNPRFFPLPPSVGENVEDRVLVDLVVSLALSFRAVLVGGSVTIIRLARQPHEPITTSLHLEQTGGSLVVRLARDAARTSTGLQVTGESTAYGLGLAIGATFGREPFGTVPEVMFSLVRGH